MTPGGDMGIIHLLHPLHGLGVLLNCFEEVGEPQACCPGEQGDRFFGNTRGCLFLDEDYQHAVFDLLSEEVGLDEGRGAEKCTKDVDAVVVMLDP